MIWALLAVLAVLAAPLVAEGLRVPVARRRARGVPGEIVALPGGLTHVLRDGPEGARVAVLIHGLTTPHYVWAGIAPLLAQAGYRVIRYDLFGRGFSDRPRGVEDPAFFLAQLDALLRHEGVESPYVLVGYSMGGAIATAQAARAPGDVAALALVAPTGLAPAVVPGVAKLPVLGDWAIWVLGGAFQRARLRAMPPEPSAIPDFLAREGADTRTRGFPRALISALRHTVSRDMSPEHASLARAGVPVLAIWGGQDQSVPLTSAARLAELNPEAWQHQIDDATHSLPHTRPGEVGGEILRFLAARSGPDRG